MADHTHLRRLRSDELTHDETSAIRELLWAAFAKDEHGGFAEDDWRHALGGTHFVLDVDGVIVSHASVVERMLHVAGAAIRTGYVEAVATSPARQGRGYGTAVMRAVDELIVRDYALGMLGTGSHGFYERLGWRVWQGPSSVLTSAGEVATPEDDGYIMFLLTPSSPPVDPSDPIACEWREGDVW